MNEALSSILCSENKWFFSEWPEHIVFKADGTGELYCCGDMCWFVSLAFSWRILPTPRAAAPAAAAASWRSSAQLLGQLNVEITLEHKLAPSVPESMRRYSKRLTEDILRDDAFRPKAFTIRIEKGNFREPSIVGVKGWPDSRYSMRLLFDKSPSPPREEWMEPEKGPDALRYWEHVEFVARHDKSLEGKGTAMNDASTGCVVC